MACGVGRLCCPIPYLAPVSRRRPFWFSSYSLLKDKIPQLGRSGVKQGMPGDIEERDLWGK